MKSLCIKSVKNCGSSYTAGVIYNSCPVLCGYQISDDTESSWEDCDIKSVSVFLDRDYKEHFQTVK